MAVNPTLVYLAGKTESREGFLVLRGAAAFLVYIAEYI